MSNGLSAPRRVSLLSTGLAQVIEENSGSRTLTPTPEPPQAQEHSNHNAALNSALNEASLTPQFNPGFNFEMLPLNTRAALLSEGTAADYSPTAPLPPGTPPTRPTSRAIKDQLPTYGDEIVPLTPSARNSSLLLPKSPLADTPIRSDSHASRLRKGHTLLKLQDSAKVLKFQDPKAKNKFRLHRALSENETTKFDPIHGKRFDTSDKHIPMKSNPYEEKDGDADVDMKESKSYAPYRLKATAPKSQAKYRDLEGLQDEYLPDFDFGDALKKWTASETRQQLNPLTNATSSLETSYLGDSSLASSLGELHAQVGPVSVPATKRTLEEEEAFIQSQLPENFESLPFSMRRKAVTQLSLSLNVDEEVLKKVAKRASLSKSRSSLAQQFIESFGSARSLKPWEEGSSVFGYKLGRTLGIGGWGFVRRATNESGDVKAVKVVLFKKDNPSIHAAVREATKKEARVWRKLHHPNLLPLYGFKEHEDCVFFLTDKIGGGNLFDLVVKWGCFNPQKEDSLRVPRLGLIKHYMLQVVEALMYMHSKGVVHGDVKLENCMIDDSVDEKGKIVVGDFGMSVQFKAIEESDDIILNNNLIKRRPSIPRSASADKNLSKVRSIAKIVVDKSKVHDDTGVELGMTPSRASSSSDVLSFDASPLQPKPQPENGIPDAHIGSIPYAAPELLGNFPPPLGPTADIWAFGVMLYTLMTGKLPFDHKYEPRLRLMINVGTFDVDFYKEACGYQEHFINVLTGCMTKDPTKRLTLEKIKEELMKADV